jgi:predicted phosphodiesterase
MSLSKDKAKEVLEYAAIRGDDAAVKVFKITHESLARYRRSFPDARLEALAKLNANCSDEELVILASSDSARVHRVKVTKFDGEEYAFAHVTDPHMGHECYDPGWWQSVVDECKKQKINKMYLTGDVTDGLCGRRDGHVYELTHIGYTRQKDYAVKELKKFDGEIFMIDGNHDRFYQKSSGALIVEDIAKQDKRWHFLGQDEGKHLVNGVDIRLWHGEDSSSYAISYRIQKICEGFTGGEKPAVLLLGHVHKMGYFFERNIHCISGGTLEHQTKWMRAKRIPAHCGWWIVRLVIKDKEVKSCTATWYPFYR